MISNLFIRVASHFHWVSQAQRDINLNHIQSNTTQIVILLSRSSYTVSFNDMFRL